MESKKDKDDAIKHLAEEFKSDGNLRYRSVKTTKQLIQNIAEATAYLKQEKQLERLRGELDVTNALNGLAILAILIFLFSINRESDSEYLGGWRFYAYIISVSFTTIWIGVNIERIFLVRELWRFGITKLIISLSFTALVIFSTATASAEINNIFGIDPSYFPFTRGFLTAYIFFTHASQLVYFLLLTAALNILPVGGYLKKLWDGLYYEEIPWKSLSFIVLTLVFTYFSWGWVSNNFDKELLREKIYILAHQLDFNDNNLCKNLKNKNVSVIFLGAEQKQVLVDFNMVKPDDVSSFIEGERSFRLEMKELRVLPCLY